MKCNDYIILILNDLIMFTSQYSDFHLVFHLFI